MDWGKKIELPSLDNVMNSNHDVDELPLTAFLNINLKWEEFKEIHYK